MHGWETVCNCTRDTLWFQLQAALLHSVSAAAAGGKQILNFGNLEISLGLRGVRRGVCVHAGSRQQASRHHGRDDAGPWPCSCIGALLTM